ncbi:MAG: hypothetical protein WKF82_10035 [Nocardioidaceae bacterium]
MPELPSTHSTDGNTALWRVALTVELANSPARTVEIAAPGSTSTGDVLDELAAQQNGQRLAGAVLAQSAITGEWLDRDLPVAASGLLRGEYLRLSAGLDAPARAGVLKRWNGQQHPADSRGRVQLNRPPRTTGLQPVSHLTIPPEPQPPRRRHFPFGAIILPLVLAGGMFLLVRRVELLLFVLLSPVMVLWNQLEETHSGRRDYKSDLRRHQERVAEVLTEADRNADLWLQQELASHPSWSETKSRLAWLTEQVWERRAGDPDFLELRLGRGQLRAPIEIAGDAAPPAHYEDLEQRQQAFRCAADDLTS